MYVNVFHITQNSGGEIVDKFGEMNVIYQYFTQPSPVKQIDIQISKTQAQQK